VLPTAYRSLTPTSTPRSAVVVNALYPVLDIGLILGVLGILLGYRWLAPPGMWTFGAGVVGLAVQDAAYLAVLAEGAFHPGTPLSGLGLLSTATIAFAAWAPRGAGRARTRYLPGLIVPAALSGLCVVVLVLAAVYDGPLPAVSLAAAGLFLTIARTLMSFHGLRQLSAVRREARTDDLTGLANRRAFYEALERALRHRSESRPMAVLMLDLDGFKAVNDSLGHHRGDELLGLVAARLQMVMRDRDMVARIGGDEFGVLLADADGELADDVAKRLRAAARGPFTLAGRSLVVGISAGIAIWPQDGREGTELLQRADTAVYAAKDDRVGQSFFRPDYHRAGQARLETTEELREAIAQGQFVLHYQPKVRLSDGGWNGVEALARWQHPSQGLLPPAAFLQQAESGGLMHLLTADILGQAIDQWVAWKQAGTPLSVAVNLSVSDLLNRDLPDEVAAVLAERGAPGAALVLELTEDLLLADPARGHGVLKELVAHGVRVQVDDYGTGFSTLGYLRDLPELDGLKLDRTFVTHVVSDRRSAAIVESTVSLAGALGLELIAEGIEDEEARLRLIDLGVQVGQGWLFGRPTPAEQLFELAGAPTAGPVVRD
jgi:diguanylate cyclase (GGDEF)-like protein